MRAFSLHEIRDIDGLFGRIEKWVLVLLLGFLIGFSLLQIILRNFFSTGFVWGDTVLRHAVLWISLLGAGRATAEDRHIRIDLMPRLLPKSGAAVLSVLIDFFSFAVCVVLIYASWSFISYEMAAATFAFGRIPLWWFESIFPFSFTVMAVRFALRAYSGIGRMTRRAEVR
ncbi:MAG: TRAP transporter small permease subunit [Desulfoferrobacter sp.]